jgi:dTDP-4-dehydrorhamnose 3,5-epimerase-like enzyme
MPTTINDCRIIDLPKIHDLRGNLTYLESLTQIPMDLKRVFWIYDVPGGELRGGHAMKTMQEFIIALSGSFDVLLDDGTRKVTYTLNRSFYGLYVPQLIWRQMINFSTNSVALVVASTPYDEDDYILHFDEFISVRRDCELHSIA